MDVTGTLVGGAIGIGGALASTCLLHRWDRSRERRAFQVRTLTELQEALDSALSSMLSYATMSQVAIKHRTAGSGDPLGALQQTALALAHIRSRAGLLGSPDIKSAARLVEDELTELAGASPTVEQMAHLSGTLRACSDLVADALRSLQGPKEAAP